MSIKVSGVDIPNAIVNLEFQVGKLSKIVEWMLNHHLSSFSPRPDQNLIRRIEDEVVNELNKKYPDLGIQRGS